MPKWKNLDIRAYIKLPSLEWDEDWEQVKLFTSQLRDVIKTIRKEKDIDIMYMGEKIGRVRSILPKKGEPNIFTIKTQIYSGIEGKVTRLRPCMTPSRELFFTCAIRPIK